MPTKAGGGSKQELGGLTQGSFKPSTYSYNS